MTSNTEQNKTVIALGYFDGVHRGHVLLAKTARELAESLGAQVVTLSFTMDTQRLAQKGTADLLTFEQKKERLLAAGVQRVECDSFESIRNLTAKEYFLQRILPLRPAALCFGQDYTLGCDRRDTEYLRELAGEYSIECVKLEKICDTNGVQISASEIRRLLSLGEVEKANELLGYIYEIRAQVIYGDSRARTLGYPTINQPFAAGVLFRAGVYASITRLPDGSLRRSVTNIGVRPTFYSNGECLAETHILDWSGDLYGSTAAVSLCSFIRPEQHFADSAQLAKAIERDAQLAREKTVATNLVL